MINGTQNTKIPLTWFQLLQILQLKLILRLGGLGQYKERVRSSDAPSSHTELPSLRTSMQGASFVPAHQVTSKLHPPKKSPQQKAGSQVRQRLHYFSLIKNKFIQYFKL